MDINLEEQVMDDAVGTALGMETGPESASGGDAKSRRALRETVARLAAASPHMKPPEALRARILQATATQSYKIEDYRKVGREDYRWYKWGFYAAALFLVLGALFNIDAGNKLQKSQGEVAMLQNNMKVQQQQTTAAINGLNASLATLISPDHQQIVWPDEQNRPMGVAIVSPSIGHAVLILSKEAVPEGFQPHLTLKTSDGKVHEFNTSLVVAPAQELHFAVPKDAPNQLPKMFNNPTLTPGQPGQPYVAGYP